MEPKSPRDEELVNNGWRRQFSASSPRLDEAVEEYEGLGFEVLVEPVDLTPSAGSCTSCLTGDPDYVKVIYTRPAQIR